MNRPIIKSQSGRSMVEMLGVLAIIGVLSVGGIAGYNTAMDRHRANQVLNTWNLASTQFDAWIEQLPRIKDTDDLTRDSTYTQDLGNGYSYKLLSARSNIYQSTNGCNYIYVNFPFEINQRICEMVVPAIYDDIMETKKERYNPQSIYIPHSGETINNKTRDTVIKELCTAPSGKEIWMVGPC